MDRIYCGKECLDGSLCRGVHSCTPTELGWLETCTGKCGYKELHHNRRKQHLPVEVDRRKV